MSHHHLVVQIYDQIFPRLVVKGGGDNDFDLTPIDKDLLYVHLNKPIITNTSSYLTPRKW